MMIDIFNHILPPKYLEARGKKALTSWASSQASMYVRTMSALCDLDARFRIVGKNEPQKGD